MNKSIFDGSNVIVQGITGTHGAFHTARMRASGANIVAGVSPQKAGTSVDTVPVYATIKDIQADFTVDISVIFVPAAFVKAAIIEAIDANVPLIICITEGAPIHDMLYIKHYMKGKSSVLIGPNSPGVLLPGVHTLGIIPASMGIPGKTGVISRSGTLTYELTAGLSQRGIGQRYVIGIGGDPIRGTNFTDCLQLFEDDPDVEQIVMIGEIGGTDELLAADYIREHITKPVYGYIAGHAAPAGVQLGHAGAILGSDQESAQAKTAKLEEVGVITSTSITELINSVKLV
jgi:succinyl-CoA synthetase alpha subunit